LRLGAAVHVELGPGDVEVPAVGRVLAHVGLDPGLVLVRLDAVEQLDDGHLGVPGQAVARGAGDDAAVGSFWSRVADGGEGDEGVDGQTIGGKGDDVVALLDLVRVGARDRGPGAAGVV